MIVPRRSRFSCRSRNVIRAATQREKVSELVIILLPSSRHQPDGFSCSRLLLLESQIKTRATSFFTVSPVYTRGFAELYGRRCFGDQKHGASECRISSILTVRARQFCSPRWGYSRLTIVLFAL